MNVTRIDGSDGRWILSVLFALTIAACSGDDAPNEVKERARTVTVAKIQLRHFLDVTAATGLLVPWEEAAVAAEQSGYRVVEVFVEKEQSCGRASRSPGWMTFCCEHAWRNPVPALSRHRVRRIASKTWMAPEYFPKKR